MCLAEQQQQPLIFCITPFHISWDSNSYYIQSLWPSSPIPSKSNTLFLSQCFPSGPEGKGRQKEKVSDFFLLSSLVFTLPLVFLWYSFLVCLHQQKNMNTKTTLYYCTSVIFMLHGASVPIHFSPLSLLLPLSSSFSCCTCFFLLHQVPACTPLSDSLVEPRWFSLVESCKLGSISKLA